jgi:glyceraldehyde-3-phosphate dehydrogenase (NADP+)
MVVAKQTHESLFDHLITGEQDGTYRLDFAWQPPVDGSTISIPNPQTGAIVGKVHAFSRSEIDMAMQRAKETQTGWAQLPVDWRAGVLERAATALEDRIDYFGHLLMSEIAKAKKEARDEVKRSADFLRFTSEEGRRLQGESLLGDAFPGYKRNKIGMAYRVPLGIVLAIPPFNYPVNLAISKIAPGLIAGNAVILKPPTQGALSGVALTMVLLDAGVPDGVLQAITGRGSEIGDYLIQHPSVDMISFTGSTETGQSLAKKSGMLPLMLELGGKDAAIVLMDADLDAAARDIVSGAFSYSGQRCTAVKRVLVTDQVADELVAHIVDRVRQLSVGRAEDDSTITCLINTDSADFVEELINDSKAAGATLLVGGRREGNLIYPTVFDHVTEAMRLAWEEPFGPVLPIIRVHDAAEAVRIANRSEYGLQSAIFTKDINAAIKIADLLEVGTVQINGKTSRGPDHFPFLGTKSSGMGTQGVRHSIEAMSRPKALVFNIEETGDLTGIR